MLTLETNTYKYNKDIANTYHATRYNIYIKQN